MKTKLQEFDEALLKAVNVERASVYGHPYDHFERSAAIKAQLRACSDARMRHVLEMIADKMARLIHSPTHFDSWLDIAGYARTAIMCLDKAEESRKLTNLSMTSVSQSPDEHPYGGRATDPS